jgi:4-amino-4-deoxy-L-arabinose transferase-like glycosyltransferase
MARTHRTLWLLVAILLLAAAARLFQIEAQSIWFDEGWSAYAAAQPTLIDAFNADLTNPPLYYLLLNLFAGAAGTSEFALRWFSALFGLLAIPLSAVLARRLFPAYRQSAALFAGLLAAIMPLLWWAGQEARMYTLLAVLVMLCALAWHDLMRGRADRRAWITLWAAELALLYAHNTGPVIVLWLNAITLIAWIGARSARRPDWRLWLGGQIGVGLLWLPYFVNRFLLLGEANAAVSSAPVISLELLGQMWGAFWTGPWAMVGREPLLVSLSLILLVVTLVITPWRRVNARWLVVHLLLLIGGLLAALILLGNELHGRYLVMTAPLLAVLIGGGLAHLRSRPLRALALMPALAAALLAVISAQNPDHGHDDARSLVRYYAETLTADDSVIAWSYADRYELAYYWERFDVAARRITLPEGADLDAVLPQLPQSGDVALNVWYTQRADYRGMLGCLLGAGTVNPPEAFTVYGMTNLLYRAPELSAPAWTPVNVTFDGGGAPVARLEAAVLPQSTPADRAQCLPLRLTLLHPVPADLKAALIIENALGWEIARADAIFAQADQRTSADLGAGEVLTAYPLLRLPYGTPAGEYRLLLRVYAEAANPSGYAPRAESFDVIGRDLVLAGWDVTSGADWSAVTRDITLASEVNLPVSSDLTLTAHSGRPDDSPVVANGEEIRLTLLWTGAGQPPDLTLADVAGRWQVISAAVERADGALIDWRTLRVPPDADSGEAELRLPDGTVIARYAVEARPYVITMPTVEASLDFTFTGVGDLVGVSGLGAGLDLADAPEITLVWRAGESAPEVSYTVFVQALGPDGRVLAQSDAIPAAGTRPTTGWRLGEIIVDVHALRPNAGIGELPETARLIAGLYDARSGERVRLPDGSDAALLADSVAIRP